MSSRVWNLISLVSLVIIAGVGAKIYFDNTTSVASSDITKVSQPAPTAENNTPDYAPASQEEIITVASTKPEKTHSKKQMKLLKGLWKNCNNLDADKRLKGCSKIIKSRLEKGEILLLAYTNRASAYGEQEKYPKAIKDYSFIINQDPDNYEAFISRGDIWQISNRFDKAIDDYTTAITIKKNDYNPYLSRAWAYYQMDKVNAGIIDLDKAIKINKTNSELYAARGQFYETIGRNKAAAKDYSTSLKFNAKLVEAIDGLKRTGKGSISAKNKK